MEWGTVGQSELKGNVGRDLAVLRERLGEVEKAKGKATEAMRSAAIAYAADAQEDDSCTLTHSFGPCDGWRMHR